MGWPWVARAGLSHICVPLHLAWAGRLSCTGVSVCERGPDACLRGGSSHRSGPWEAASASSRAARSEGAAVNTLRRIKLVFGGLLSASPSQRLPPDSCGSVWRSLENCASCPQSAVHPCRSDATPGVEMRSWNAATLRLRSMAGNECNMGRSGSLSSAAAQPTWIAQAHEPNWPWSMWSRVVPPDFLSDAPATRALLYINTCVYGIEKAFVLLTGLSLKHLLGQVNIHILQGGQWWRLITSNVFHRGFFHLVTNMLLLWLFGPWLEQVVGTGRMYAVIVASGLTAGLLELLLLPPATYLSYGFSTCAYGIVTGIGTYYAVNREVLGSCVKCARESIELLGIAVPIAMAFGMIPTSPSNLAHFGGAIGGTAMIGLLGPVFRDSDGPGSWSWKRHVRDAPPLPYMALRKPEPHTQVTKRDIVAQLGFHVRVKTMHLWILRAVVACRECFDDMLGRSGQ